MGKTNSAKCIAHAQSWYDSAERELKTAQHLRSQGMDWSNVYWHAGFAVEHMLKAIRTKRDCLEKWPNADKGRAWHQIEYIASRAGVDDERVEMAKSNVSFEANWLTVKDWDQQKRYPGSAPSKAEARDMLTSVANPTSGVMKWLRQVYLNS